MLWAVMVALRVWVTVLGLHLEGELLMFWLVQVPDFDWKNLRIGLADPLN